MSAGADRWESHKVRTRQLINDAAMTLFVEHGFDNVTVAQVAAAAGVSPATVFNYFEAKENLFFDEVEPLVADLVSTVTQCPPGASILDELRADIGRHLTGGRGPRQYREVEAFHAAVSASPDLQRYEQKIAMYRKDRLTAAIADAVGADEPQMRAQFAAAQYVMIEHLVCVRVREELHRGVPLATALESVAPAIDALFTDMQSGVGPLPKRPRDAEHNRVG